MMNLRLNKACNVKHVLTVLLTLYIVSRVYNRKEGEYPTHYSTVYHPFTGVSDLSSIIHNLWYHTTPLTTTTWLYTKQLQVQLDSTHAEPQ